MYSQRLAFMPKIFFPGTIFFGKGPTVIKEYITEKTLIVISRSFYETNQFLISSVVGPSRQLFFQSGEPTEEHIAALTAQHKTVGHDRFVAIGGGSVIDLVKLVKRDVGVPMVAVPTTIGSGSEVSQHAPYLSGTVKKVKSGQDFLPDVVVLDPVFLHTLSDHHILFESFDALAHALESLVSRLAHPLSDFYALGAIDRIVAALTSITQGTTAKEHLGSLQIAAVAAGLAQSSAATGLAHAFAHYVGPLCHLPHAEAVARFLLPVIRLNHMHGAAYSKLNVLSHVSEKTIEETIEIFMQKLLPPFSRLSLLQPRTVAVEGIRKDICAMTNPYAATPHDIETILSQYV